ncbi:hypothetical protein [Bradyrhizobium sp. CB82]|uniref:hypothetical protein n=1 Tax=Bradyrhizobium sp. CB82 TaxID=3039159 RepID=UPI0032C2387E
MEPNSSICVPFSQHTAKKVFETADSSAYSLLSWRASGYFYACHVNSNYRIMVNPMLKFVVLGIASLAFVGTAVAADMPRPQPVAAAPTPVGKYPVGKYPVGKSPVGKYPVAAPAPLVTKG